MRRLARRDTVSDADRFTLFLDPHHDHFTGVMFEVSAANVRRDASISNDTSRDDSWDGVWDSAVTVDEDGWTLEMRIPFSQLRFSEATQHTWGINAARYIQRKNETSWLELVPKSENCLASRMAHLTGLSGVDPERNLEMMVYGVLSPEFVAPSAPGDPFNDGSRIVSGSGLDIKYGLSSSFTLDATINPDFGQVEVDPAVVNLGAFETFFQERRPFFVEGSRIFSNFGREGSNRFFGFNRSTPTIFYSRRIGRGPQGQASGEFVDRPRGTTILGAGKVTGRTASGWTVGLLGALTGREYADVEEAGTTGSIEVEPRTNYVAARLLKETRWGGLGALLTGVEWDLRSPALKEYLPESAYVAGGDGYFFFDDDHDWVVTGSLSGSWVQGSRESLERLQRNPQRYFQRPDATHVALDPTATTLKGWSGNLDFNRNGGERWLVNASLWGTSPGFESNDAGLNFAGDAWGSHVAFTLRKLNPDRWTRNRNVTFVKSWNWNFDNRMTADGYMVFGNTTFRNYWGINGAFGLNGRTQNDRLTRGGPAATGPAGGFANFNLRTDNRKSVSGSLFGSYGWNELGDWNANGNLSFTFKPLPSLTITTGPDVRRSIEIAQYVETVSDPTATHTFGSRYLFSDLDQSEVSMVTRVNWIFTANTSLEIYAQPLISVGDYWSLKEFVRPGGFEFRPYGSADTQLDYLDEGREYLVDPDGSGPASSFSVEDPSFNFKSLRLNAVFRWEWRLGSTLHLVWTQNRVDTSNPGQLSTGRDIGRLLKAPSDDIFLVKFAFRFGR